MGETRWVLIRSLVGLRPPNLRSEMGKEQRDLLLTMSYAAHQEAHKHLSDAGREVLEMMEYASRNSGIPIADAYV